MLCFDVLIMLLRFLLPSNGVSFSLTFVDSVNSKISAEKSAVDFPPSTQLLVDYFEKQILLKERISKSLDSVWPAYRCQFLWFDDLSQQTSEHGFVEKTFDEWWIIVVLRTHILHSFTTWSTKVNAFWKSHYHWCNILAPILRREMTGLSRS